MTTGPSQEPSGAHYSTLPKDTEARLLPGSIVAEGRIEIVEELGRGGMAIVYRARDLERGGPEVAFKIVTAQANAADTEARYKNEARLGKSLGGDPSFVRPLGVGCLGGPAGFEGRMFLVSELVTGTPLDRLMLEHPRGMPMDRACSIASNVARALVSLHARGIVHRDIKPSNVLLEGDREAPAHVRLIDFGLAYATGDGWEPKSQDLTEEGHAPGTPIYMSPQQIVHERPTPAFDVYAFGVLFYELVSGHPPHEDVALQTLISRKCDPQCRPFPIEKMRQKTPTHVAELVGRCLAYEQSERPTAAEILAILDPAAVDERPVAAPELRLVPKTQPSVVAPGARPAGDATRADLERKSVALPFVKRAETSRNADLADAEGWAASDEARVISKAAVAQVAAAVKAEPPSAAAVVEAEPPSAAEGLATEPPSAAEGLATEPPSAAAAAPVRPSVTEEPAAPSRLRPVLIFVVLAALGGLAFAAYRAAAPGDEDDGTATRPPKNVVSPASASATPDEEAPAGAEADLPAAKADDTAVAPTPNADDPTIAPTPNADDTAVVPAPEERPPTKVAKPKKGPAPPPKKTKKHPPTCPEHQSLAADARAKKKWTTVLAHTKDATCWSGAKGKRERLRVEALMRLGRYMACVREASRSKDATVAGWRRECYRKAADDSPKREQETSDKR